MSTKTSKSGEGKLNSLRTGPDDKGFFGLFGGRFVAETLMPLILSLEKAYDAAKADPSFQAELDSFLEHYVGRPSPLYLSEALSQLHGCKIYLKREDLNHTGAHKINNAIGQILLAKHMGNNASSLRPVLGSTALQRPRCAP